MCRMTTITRRPTCRQVLNWFDQRLWKAVWELSQLKGCSGTNQNAPSEVKSAGSGVRPLGCQLSDLGRVMWPQEASVSPLVNMSRFFIKFFKASIQKHFNWLITISSYKHKLDPRLLSIYHVLGSGIKRWIRHIFLPLKKFLSSGKANGESSVEWICEYLFRAWVSTVG